MQKPLIVLAATLAIVTSGNLLPAAHAQDLVDGTDTPVATRALSIAPEQNVAPGATLGTASLPIDVDLNLADNGSLLADDNLSTADNGSLSAGEDLEAANGYGIVADESTINAASGGSLQALDDLAAATTESAAATDDSASAAGYGQAVNNADDVAQASGNSVAASDDSAAAGGYGQALSSASDVAQANNGSVALEDSTANNSNFASGNGHISVNGLQGVTLDNGSNANTGALTSSIVGNGNALGENVLYGTGILGNNYGAAAIATEGGSATALNFEGNGVANAGDANGSTLTNNQTVFSLR